VRCTALKVAKFRLKNSRYGMAVARAGLNVRHPTDHASGLWAAMQFARCYRATEADLSIITDYMQRQDIGTCGPALSQIGVMLFRGKVIRKGEHMFVPATLHLYGLGCRDWGLHGMEKRILAKEEFRPAVKKKIADLKREIERLAKARPACWHERARRYEHAAEGLQQLVDQAAEKKKKRNGR